MPLLPAAPTTHDEQRELEAALERCRRVLSNLALLSDVSAQRLNAAPVKPQKYSGDTVFPKGVNGNAKPGPDRAPSWHLSPYRYYRWNMEQAKAAAETYAEGTFVDVPTIAPVGTKSLVSMQDLGLIG